MFAESKTNKSLRTVLQQVLVDFWPGDRSEQGARPPALEALESRLLLDGGPPVPIGTEYTVNTLIDVEADDDLVSLREAVKAARLNQQVNEASPGQPGPQFVDKITFGPEAAGGTIELGSMLSVGDDVIIDGGEDGITLDGLDGNRIMWVMLDGDRRSNVQINSVTFKDGDATDAGQSGYGGAILNYGDLTVTDCHFDSNEAISGGAIYSIGELVIDHSTVGKGGGNRGAVDVGDLPCAPGFANPTSPVNKGGGVVVNKVGDAPGKAHLINSLFVNGWTLVGGGLAVLGAADVTVTNCTLAENTARDAGGGIYASHATSVKIYNTVVADNNFTRDPQGAPPGVGHDIYGSMASAEHNWVWKKEGGDHNVVNLSDGNHVGADPNLQGYKPVVGDGGSVLTSGIIDEGDNDLALDAAEAAIEKDLDGFARISGDNVDIGAYELAQAALNGGGVVGDDSIFLTEGTSSAENISGSQVGAGALFLDVAYAGDDYDVDLYDFEYHVWNEASQDWAFVDIGDITLTVTDLGDDLWRVGFEFDEGEVENTWLRLTVLANDETAFVEDQELYMGFLMADLNGDGVVNGTDMMVMWPNYGQTTTEGVSAGDINLDGVVNATDLQLLQSNFGGALDLNPLVV